MLFVLLLDLGERGQLLHLGWRWGEGLGELGLRGHGQGRDEHLGHGRRGSLWRLDTR